MSEIILHHYPPSPFSEKVRVALGMKKLAWRSVEIPRVPPKPELMPLTGGYRRTPVMQIGADIYCDSQCILRELQRRFPQPTFYPGGADGLPWAVNRWTDVVFDSAGVQGAGAVEALRKIAAASISARTTTTKRSRQHCHTMPHRFAHSWAGSISVWPADGSSCSVTNRGCLMQ